MIIAIGGITTEAHGVRRRGRGTGVGDRLLRHGAIRGITAAVRGRRLMKAPGLDRRVAAKHKGLEWMSHATVIFTHRHDKRNTYTMQKGYRHNVCASV